MRVVDAKPRYRKRQIDLGLEVIAMTRKPGETMTQADIAEVCGCSKVMISRIERQAIEKLRRAAERHPELADAARG